MEFNATQTVSFMNPEQENSIYRTMMDLSSDVVFEWDTETDRFTCSSKWLSRFGYTPLSDHFFQNLPRVAHVHPDDMALLSEQVELLRQGVSFGETIVRILNSNGRYTWNRIRASAQFHADGTLRKLIGVITDIDSDQRNSQALLAKSEQDSLTGLLNKDAARRRINSYLAHATDNQRAALLIIDLDNFKAINDQFGHLFGDTVLNRVAGTIRSLFREKDILARIGGDEFLVFMMDIPDSELVERRCEKLTDALQHLYDSQLQNYRFSCSIGIVIMPDHGTGYQELFRRADRALYQAKDLGKNTYTCYSSNTAPTRYETKINQRIESNEQRHDLFGTLAANVLERLYENRDLPATVHATLEQLGMHLQPDRIFLFNPTDPRKNYEWVKTGTPDVPAIHDLLMKLTPADALESLFREEDVFYCHDSSILPEILQPVAQARNTKALLLCAVRTKGVFRGVVGMEACVHKRLWTKNEIEVLTFASHVASLFLWRSAQIGQ